MHKTTTTISHSSPFWIGLYLDSTSIKNTTKQAEERWSVVIDRRHQAAYHPNRGRLPISVWSRSAAISYARSIIYSLIHAVYRMGSTLHNNSCVIEMNAAKETVSKYFMYVFPLLTLHGTTHRIGEILLLVSALSLKFPFAFLQVEHGGRISFINLQIEYSQNIWFHCDLPLPFTRHQSRALHYYIGWDNRACDKLKRAPQFSDCYISTPLCGLRECFL